MRPIGLALLVFLATTKPLAAEEGTSALYAGTVGGKRAVTMELIRNGSDLQGAYRYGRRFDVLTLKGTEGADGKIDLTEIEPHGRTTGKISGKLQAGCIEGEWSSPDGARRLPLKVCELSKKQALTAAIGTFHLTAVSGNAGANTMFDIEKSGKRWSVTGSFIGPHAMREAGDFGLDKQEVEFLNSLRVQVGKDLSVRFVAGDTTIRRIPFNEKGMEHTLTSGESSLSYFETPLGKVSPSTAFIHGRLFLAAISEVDYSGLVDSGLLSQEPGQLIVTYVTGLDSFEIQMGQMTLTLTRR
jgi:hypothetical protein